ncbi:uncharacterized protein [Canis lupus baileyi]|uniref:uncharacterized protein n=1 Tax=Canis lupus baileyi TaxID=143281 RepID=UPI003B9707E4
MGQGPLEPQAGGIPRRQAVRQPHPGWGPAKHPAELGTFGEGPGHPGSGPRLPGEWAASGERAPFHPHLGGLRPVLVLPESLSGRSPHSPGSLRASGPSAGTARHLRREARPAGLQTAGLPMPSRCPASPRGERAEKPEAPGLRPCHRRPFGLLLLLCRANWRRPRQTAGEPWAADQPRKARQGNRVSHAGHGLRDAGRPVPCGPATSTPGPLPGLLSRGQLTRVGGTPGCRPRAVGRSERLETAQTAASGAQQAREDTQWKAPRPPRRGKAPRVQNGIPMEAGPMSDRC